MSWKQRQILNSKQEANVLFDVGDKFDIKAKEAYCDAPHSYGPDCIATETNKKTFLNQVYAGLAAQDIAFAASAAAGGPGASAAVSVAKKGYWWIVITMTFTGNRTNFEHIFGAKVTFYKPINAQGIVATNVNFQNVVTSGTVSISGPTSITSLNVTGITTVTTLNSTTINATSSSTFNDITINGKIYDGDGNFGTTGHFII